MPTDLITEERAGSSASSTSESHANTSGSSGHMGGNQQQGQGTSSSRMPDSLFSHHPPSGPSPSSPHVAVPSGTHGGPTSTGSVYDSAPPSAGSSCERGSTEPSGVDLVVS